MTTTHKETLGFQTEVKQLLQLMIHSLYSNREIFLRELISNASDACDKLRFEAIDKPALLEGGDELAVEVIADREARTITIRDNGIGMSRQEIIDNLGTIARSGTREFFDKLASGKADSQLIGQFGVGFYSAFIVADHVTVRSRRAGLPASEGVQWESDGSGEFTVETIERAQRGTEVVLHLRPDNAQSEESGPSDDDLLDAWKLKAIVRKYSDHISLPIRMPKEEWDKDAGKMKTLDELETVNQASALWTRPKSEITEEQYDAFYQHLTHDPSKPLAHTHNRVEGRTEYIQLLYLPSHAPFDLWDRQHRSGIQLYVRRVFIMDDAEQLMPVYLRFVKGVIDSSDLPLNVSREILQESRDVRAIRDGSVKRVLTMIEELATDADKYPVFWREFGQVLKEGVGEDSANQARIAGLLRFASTAQEGAEQTVSFAQYIERMKPKQDKIYYVTGDSFSAARNSPHLEIFRKKGVEVLLLSDRVDEWMLSFLNEFDGKQLVSVARGGLDLGELEDAEEKAQAQKANDEYKDLVERIKTVLGDRVKDVRVTLRLTDSPSCLVSDDNDISGNLQRLLRQSGQKAPDHKPILEINPDHPLVKRLRSETTHFDDWARLLFDQASLSEGGQLDDPADFVKRLNEMLLALSLRS